jgi:predicted DNA-binding transcriptional regulator AlpA
MLKRKNLMIFCNCNSLNSYQQVMRTHRTITKRFPDFQDYSTSISNDMTEAGCGGASAGATDGLTTTPAAPDDDGGDGDGDPDRRKHQQPHHSSASASAINHQRQKQQVPHSAADSLFWTMPTVSRRIGLSRSNIYQQIQSGKFPEPVKIGRSSRWLATEIQAWVTAQAYARSPKTAR